MTVLARELGPLGFGGAQAGNLEVAVGDDVVAAAVAAAWDTGIRYFDTAPHYGLGLSERRLGRILRTYPRDEFVLSTKVGRLLEPSPGTASGDDDAFAVPADRRRVWDFSRDGVLRSLEESLERLGLDRVDIVYVHDPDDHGRQALDEAIPALVELRDQGVVRAIGAGMNQSAMLARFVRETDVDVVMCAGRFTLLDQPALTDLLPLAQERGVPVVIAGAYNSGLLAQPVPAQDATYDYAPVPGVLLERARRMARVCASHGVSLPAAALAYIRAHPAVPTIVLGMRTPDHVHEAVARSATPAPDGLWTDLAAAGLLAEHALPSHFPA